MLIAIKHASTFTEGLIDLFSGGKGYCHAMLVLDNPAASGLDAPCFLTSTAETGATLGILDADDMWKNYTVYDIGRNNFARAVLGYAYPELGSPYDFLGVMRWVVPFVKGSRHAWFCTEFVVYLCQKATDMFKKLPAAKVSPDSLAERMDYLSRYQEVTGVQRLN